MGMYGEWLRVSPAELERAKTDLQWLRQLANDITKTESESDVSEPASGRHFGTDKTWHALDFLLYLKGFPIAIVSGEEDFVEDYDDPASDWGYGPPRYLTPEQVSRAAAALTELTGADLIDGVEQSMLQEAEIYPEVWDRPGELEWAVCHLPYVKVYFDRAARAGDGMVCWIG